LPPAVLFLLSGVCLMSHRRLPVAIVLSLLCWAGGVCGPVTPVHAQALLETVPEAVGLSSSRLQRM